MVAMDQKKLLETINSLNRSRKLNIWERGDLVATVFLKCHDKGIDPENKEAISKVIRDVSHNLKRGGGQAARIPTTWSEATQALVMGTDDRYSDQYHQ